MIFYVCIAINRTIICEYSTSAERFDTAINSIFEKLPVGQAVVRRSFDFEKYFFSVIVESGVTYVCCSEKQSDQRTVFLCLNELQKRFLQSGYQSTGNYSKLSLQREFGHNLAQIVKQYDNSSLDQVENELYQITDQMTKNISALSSIGNRMATITDDAAGMSRRARTLHSKSKKVHNSQRCQRIKMFLVIAVVLLVVIYFIFGSLCGFTAQCLRS
eukprot:TRINITY_DN2551_c0_g1_i1.p1 TRINITY_DN2551_c0_g1~~TRINITY_DN2551_c0_g1_i1.p1  ORF type:complete len:216 (+),score=51.78 TRINITY_DN2551_c0_g1_i1:44-691(+)